MARNSSSELTARMAERLRAKGAKERTVRAAQEVAAQSPVMEILKTPGFQALAKSLEQRYPGLQNYRTKTETPGLSLMRALAQIADSSQDMATAQALGLPARASREQILEAVIKAAPELGASNPTELKEVLTGVQTAVAQDALVGRLFDRDAEIDKHASEEREPSERDRYAAEYRREARSTLEDAIRERDARAAREAPLAAQRRSRFYAPSERHLDIAMSKAALEGRKLDVDLTSPGARQWLKERAGFSDEDLGRVQARDDLEWQESVIEAKQLEQQQIDEHEASLEETPEAAAGGGGGSDASGG